MGGVSNKTTLHITRVLDLTYFSRSQRTKLVGTSIYWGYFTVSSQEVSFMALVIF
jgi:hypothetical protein